MSFQEKIAALGNLTTPFGVKTQQEEKHGGIDVANKKGTPIPAFAGGTVVQTIDGKPHGEQSFGNSVILKDKNNIMHRYSHLANVMVKPGQQVGEGQKVGTIGDSGATYAPKGQDSSNLDFRIVKANGELLNPAQYIDSL